MLVVEDDAMVRGWIRLSLENYRVPAGRRGRERGARQVLLPRRLPELLLIDYRLSDGAGTELVRALRLQGVAAPVVLMAAHYEPGFNEVAREVGAQGSVLRTGKLGGVAQDAPLQSATGVRPSIRGIRRAIRARAALSPREREVAPARRFRRTNRQIAEDLAIGAETVKTLMTRTFAKLGVSRRAEAVATGQRMGLL